MNGQCQTSRRYSLQVAVYLFLVLTELVKDPGDPLLSHAVSSHPEDHMILPSNSFCSSTSLTHNISFSLPRCAGVT